MKVVHERFFSVHEHFSIQKCSWTLLLCVHEHFWKSFNEQYFVHEHLKNVHEQFIDSVHERSFMNTRFRSWTLFKRSWTFNKCSWTLFKCSWTFEKCSWTLFMNERSWTLLKLEKKRNLMQVFMNEMGCSWTHFIEKSVH